MRIPKYWAQYQQRFERAATPDNVSRQATIKRYGWSDSSQAAAEAHAKARVIEAHERWQAGADILRRERDEQYNESNSIPIREPILLEQTWQGQPTQGSAPHTDSQGDTQLIVTRNRYGAQVANVNNIAIIDVDHDQLLQHNYPEYYHSQGFKTKWLMDEPIPFAKVKIWVFVLISILAASAIAWYQLSWLWLLVIMIGATAYLWQQASARDKLKAKKHAAERASQAQIQADALASLSPFITDVIKQRVTSHPHESFRLYETPAGFRIIATHATAAPSDDAVAAWFEQFHADRNYVRLCRVQQCFRARLTAKPWRMAEVTQTGELAKDIPAKALWFANDSKDTEVDNPARVTWTTAYDTFATHYRACRYVTTIRGADANTDMPEAIHAFFEWHDKACQVQTDLPLA